MPATIIDSIRSEFLRHKALAEAAVDQVDDASLLRQEEGGNSIATICVHIGSNLRSRFTDFLTTDGEKPWRKRDEEFEPVSAGRDEVMNRWSSGWSVLMETLSSLSDADLWETVTIRGQSLLVQEALHRSLAHVSYHVGQIVVLARMSRGGEWRFLSIPPGQSEQYNQNPTKERP